MIIAHCLIKKNKVIVGKIEMNPNNVFPFTISQDESFALQSEHIDESHLCHLSNGHMNHKGLQLLNQKI